MAHLSRIANRPDLGYFGVGLYDTKNGYNVGGVIRATAGFGGSFVVVQGNRWKEKGDWKNMDTEGGYLRIPCHLGVQNLQDFIAVGMETVVVERTDKATSLVNFSHPKVGMYVFGPEDGAIPDDFMPTAKRIYIPSTYSLNLYSAVTAVAYDRMAKLSREETKSVSRDSMYCPRCLACHWRWVYDFYGRSNNLPANTRHCNACGHEWTAVE